MFISLHSINPLSHFDSSETNSDISCSKLQSPNLCELLTDMCSQRTDREKHFDTMHSRGKKCAAWGGKWACSLIWWIFLTYTGKKVSTAGGADMCVCPNKCVFPSSSASVSNKRCKPRLQNGSGGRKITLFSVSHLLFVWIPWKWETLPAIVAGGGIRSWL